jgi:hypothetical protein
VPTGTRVPRNSPAPPTRSAPRSTTEHEDPSIMRGSWHSRGETANENRPRCALAHAPSPRGMFRAKSHKTPLGSNSVNSRMAQGRSWGSPTSTPKRDATPEARGQRPELGRASRQRSRPAGASGSS